MTTEDPPRNSTESVPLPAVTPRETPSSAPESPEQTNRANYFVRHWRGDLPLPIAYWVNGIAVTLAFYLCFKASHVFTDAAESLGDRVAGAAMLLILLSAASISIWQLVGIWRSALKHVSRGGSHGWAVAAKAMVVISALEIANASISQAPTYREATQLAFGQDPIPAAQLSILDNGMAVEIAGGLRYGTTTQLRALLERAPKANLVYLNSVGGFISEGLRMGDFIRERGLATTSTLGCVSACILAYMGGTARSLSPGARLGFHDGAVGGVSIGLVTDRFRQGLLERGVSPDFVDRALATPNTIMWYPTEPELVQAHVIKAEP
jgi:hypothetical protein